MLDYRLELDYFSKGVRKAYRRQKTADNRARALTKAEARQRRKGKAKASQNGFLGSETASASGLVDGKASAEIQRRDSEVVPESRGARHGKAIVERAGESSNTEAAAGVNTAGPLTSSANDADASTGSSGARHGKLIHEEPVSAEEPAVASPMFNNIATSNGNKSRGIEHGRAIHHDRNQSTVSSTVTGTTAVNLPTPDDTQNAPEGIVYARPLSVSMSEAGVLSSQPTASSTTPFNPTPPLPPLEDEEPQARTNKPGRGMQPTTGQSWIPTPKGKLRVTNGMNKDELLTSPRSTPTTMMAVDDVTPPSSTPREFKKKRSAEKSSYTLAKENRAAHVVDAKVLAGDHQPHEDRGVEYSASPRKTSSIKRQQVSTPRPVTPENRIKASPRKSHEIPWTPKRKVGSSRRAATPSK